MKNTESINSLTLKNEYISCGSHPTKLAKKYCNLCQNFICNACALDDHSDHLGKISKLNSMYLKNKEILNKFLNLTSGGDSLKHGSVTFKCMNFIFHEAKNFCKDCKKFICQKCCVSHFDGTHEIIPTNDYFSVINRKVEFFLQFINNFENWQNDTRNSKIINDFSKLTEDIEIKIFEKIFDKIFKVKSNLNEILKKRKNLVLSVLNDLNKFFVEKNNLLVKNKKKIDEMENLYKKIKFEKDIIKVYENFIEFENFLESIITDKEKVKFLNLIQNLKMLDELVENFSKELMNNLNEDYMRYIDEEIINKIENVISENQNRFEEQARNSLKLDKEDFEKMTVEKEKISRYFNQEELEMANSRLKVDSDKKEGDKIISTEDQTEKDIEIIKKPELNPDHSTIRYNLPSPINEIKINNWSNLESSLVHDLFIVNSSEPIVEKIIEVKEILKPSSFKEISFHNNYNFSILFVKPQTNLNNQIPIDNKVEEESPIINIKEDVSNSNTQSNENIDQTHEDNIKKTEMSSSKNEELKEIQKQDLISNITEENLDDAFSADERDSESNSANQESPDENKAITSANIEVNPYISQEKRKTLDSEISKININVDDSSTILLNPNVKESEVIKFDTTENLTNKEEHQEKIIPEVDPYHNLSFPEKIEVAKKKIQDIRENISENSDYVEINQDGIEVEKIKLTENTISQLLEKIFTWEERNQLELMSIGHNIKTIFVFNPIVDRIKEVEFIQKFPTFHSYLNILPWVYISGGKDFESNQENSNFFKIRRESEKTFELVNLSPMQSKRSSHIMIHHSKTNSIFVISGSRNYSCERYNISTDKWDLLPSLNSSREKASACVFSGTEEFLYVFSGFDRTINKCINTVERLSLSKNNSKWEFIQIKGIQNLLKRQALSCFYINNTEQDYSKQENSLLIDSNQIHLLGGINLLKNETKDVLLFNLKANSIANHAKLVMNENFAFNHSQFVNISCYDPDLFYNFSDNFSVVILDSKLKNFRSRKLDFI